MSIEQKQCTMRGAELASRELSGNFHELKAVGGVEGLERQVIALPEGFRATPKPKMNSLESSTSSKFFIPKFFPGFAKRFHDFFLFHFRKGTLSLGNQFTQFCEMSLGFFEILFHMITINTMNTIAQRRAASQCEKLRVKGTGSRTHKHSIFFLIQFLRGDWDT